MPNVSIIDTGKLVRAILEAGSAYLTRTIAFYSQALSEAEKLAALGKKYQVPTRYDKISAREFQRILESRYKMTSAIALDLTEQLMILEEFGKDVGNVYARQEFVQATDIPGLSLQSWSDFLDRNDLTESGHCLLHTATEREPVLSDAFSLPDLSSGHSFLMTASCLLDNATYLNGAHLSSDKTRRWIESCTGESANFEKLYAIELPWTNTSRLYGESSLQSNPIFDLPCRFIVEKYVNLWCSSFESLAFPIISKWLFEETLDLAYSPQHCFGSDSAKSCIYSFLSLVTLFGFEHEQQGAVDCGSYASAAQSMVDRITQEMTLSGLESLIILTQVQYFLGDLQAATVSVSIATRLLYKFNAQTVVSPEHPSTYDKSILEWHIRDLFWLCYSWDKDICLRTGQPPSIDDTSCDLTIPSNYGQLQDSNIQRHSMPISAQTLPFYPFDPRLSKIKSDVYRSLYSASARRKSDTEVLSTIRNLDHTLEQWRVSLHADFRPTLWFSQETPISEHLNTQAVMLRLAYHHCFTIIHQASEQCSLASLPPESQPDGIRSSISLTIHASWSTLAYLQAAMPAVKDHVFWVIIFYAITAILTLFHNILKNPLDPEVSRRVDILREFPKLIRRIPIRNLTLGEIIHLRFLDGFMAELARLGGCAIMKATGEGGLEV
ncbi:hypothetical protein BJY04DRAFT_219571 [Aspergillus karnatakaensis]|uniref:transcription factor domain-containing protein n=1 Tax=Aspergillus karnatakaensis TaxID=1810916 RepID=UPI003CCCBDB5